MRDYALGLYEKSMPNSLSLAEKLAAAKDAGYDYMELSIDESDEKLARLKWTDQERAALRSDMNSAGIDLRTICLSAHRRFPLGSADEQTVLRSKEILFDAVKLAKDLNIRIIQLAGYDVYYEPSNAATRERFFRNLHDCLPEAAKSGVILAFENMETKFMNSAQKSART
ncbi:MAG: L-ribulose-5-phosphate 3-epimerase, partial [Clostridia bacterium]|nr:L-ribulose-5-phosphate 3-epimerase [Clostridia bacterium]